MAYAAVFLLQQAVVGTLPFAHFLPRPDADELVLLPRPQKIALMPVPTNKHRRFWPRGPHLKT